MAKALGQLDPFTYYIVKAGTVNIPLLNADGTSSTVLINAGNALQDMGKRIVLNGTTLVKVQLIPITRFATAANNYNSGYISLGDGLVEVSPVSRLN